jgi:hypothetical protein
MHINVTETMFKDEFKALRPDNFSYEGLSALYEWFTELEDSTGEPMELDVIAICCDYNEEPLNEVLENYDLLDEHELEQQTCVIGYTNNGENVVYQCF